MDQDTERRQSSRVMPGDARVGVIEDNPDNLDLAMTLLHEDVGVRECVAHASGAAFFQWAQASPAAAPGDSLLDLLLLDLHMPRESGYDLLVRLRAMPGLEHTRIVALTANVLQADLDRCRQAGFDGFIGKPIRLRRFPEQIRRILTGEHVWETL